MADILSLLGQASSPEELQMARADALRRKQEVAQMRSLGFIGQLSGDKVLAPLGKSFLGQAQNSEEQGVELQKADAAGKEHALSRAMAALQQQALADERAVDNKRQDARFGADETWRQWQKDHPQQMVFVNQGGEAVGVPTRQGTGAPGALKQPSGAPLRHNQPMSEGSIKEQQELDNVVSNLGNVEGQMKDEYFGSGPLGGAGVALAQTLGSWAPKTGSQFSQDAGQFWSEFDQLVTLPQRHALFGSSLTPGEKSSFERARTVNPRTDPAVAKKALAEMKAIAIRKAQGHRSMLEGQGYNPSAAPAGAQGPHGPTITQKGVTFTWNPTTGEYE